jgi:hypothetical protein
MSFSTFSGPIRSGTQRYGAGRNTGLVVLAQSTPVVFGTLTGTACILPAGAQILSVSFQTTVVFSAATTVKLTIGSTDITGTATVTTVGVATVTFATSTAALALLSNVGTTDATLTYTLAGAGLTTGAGNIIVQYVQRADDGAQNPAATQD